LEGTSVGHLVQPSCRSRVTYSIQLALPDHPSLGCRARITLPVPALTQSSGAPSPGTPPGHSGGTAFQGFLGASLGGFGLAFPRVVLGWAVPLAGVAAPVAGPCQGWERKVQAWGFPHGASREFRRCLQGSLAKL